MNATSWLFPLGLLCLGVVACGGTAYESGPDDGAGGTAAGGSGTGGASATGGSGTGGSGTGGGGTVCCLAAAICNEGDTQIDSEADCPPGATCYSNSICCSTVWCAKSNVACDADGVPTCQENEVEVSVCPDGATCHIRTLCGSSVICQIAGCDPDSEPNRTYVANSPDKCALIDFDCNSDASYFSNACGCGCEQCPAYIDCMPMICPPNVTGCVAEGTNPLCTSGECPNTPRVY